MTLIRFYLACTIGITATTSANAYCSEPSFTRRAPDPPGSHERPDVPYCLSGYSYSRTHTCDDWEIDSYKQEVSDYIDALNDYLNEASEFERRVRNYVGEVQSYAKCEADEVLSQHE